MISIAELNIFVYVRPRFSGLVTLTTGSFFFEEHTVLIVASFSTFAVMDYHIQLNGKGLIRRVKKDYFTHFVPYASPVPVPVLDRYSTAI